MTVGKFVDVGQLCAELVRIPSQNPMGREQCGEGFGEWALADFLGGLIRAQGYPVEYTSPLDGRPNLIARFDFGCEETILFEAHLDTVPADNMTVEPFGGCIAGGRLYGRGAADTKGPMAAMLCAIMQAAAEQPVRNVVFAAVCDEEYQFTGVRHLSAALTDRPVAAVVAEPTRLDPVIGHKGVIRWRARTAGRAAHSSTPAEGENAIYSMSSCVLALRDHAQALACSPSHPQLGSPTLSVGLIQGGVAANIVPDACMIEIDRRLITGEIPVDVTAHLRGLVAACGGELDEPFMAAPAFEISAASPVAQLAHKSAVAAGASPEFRYANYCTDAPFYARIGIPVVVIGPGDIAQAHTRDEWIRLDALHAGQRMYREMICNPMPLTAEL